MPSSRNSDSPTDQWASRDGRARAHLTRRPGLLVLVLEGVLTAGAAQQDLRTLFDQVVDGGDRFILVDMEGVDHVDSAGLGELVRLHCRLSQRKGRLRICGVQPNLTRLLQTTMLYMVFDLHIDREDALAGFAEEGAG